MASTASVVSLPTPLVTTSGPSAHAEGSPISPALSSQPPAGFPEPPLAARTEADSTQGAREAAERDASSALELAPADGTADPLYTCDFMCGFQGAFAEVQVHEISCALNPGTLNLGSESAVISPDVDGGDGEQSACDLPASELLSAKKESMHETQQSPVRTSKPPATPAIPGPVLRAHPSPLNRKSNYFKKQPSPAPSPQEEAKLDALEVIHALAFMPALLFCSNLYLSLFFRRYSGGDRCAPVAACCCRCLTNDVV